MAWLFWLGIAFLPLGLIAYWIKPRKFEQRENERDLAYREFLEQHQK